MKLSSQYLPAPMFSSGHTVTHNIFCDVVDHAPGYSPTEFVSVGTLVPFDVTHNDW